MFARGNRFSFKSGLPAKTIPSQSFTLKYGANEEGLKVAVVVSKKVDKRAVVRNKIKRQILEIVKKLAEINKFLSLVFYVKQSALTNQNLEEEIKNVFGQIK